MSNTNEGLIEAVLTMVRDTEVPLELRQTHMAALRQTHPALGPQLDTAMLDHCGVELGS